MSHDDALMIADAIRFTGLGLSVSLGAFIISAAFFIRAKMKG